MIPRELQSRLRWQLDRRWKSTFGPVDYAPPTREQCEALGFTHEEGVAFYDKCLKEESGMKEIAPGQWDWEKQS